MAQGTSRLGLDLDEIERQMRHAQPAPAPQGDPLVELARIVGQDDPFRAVLSAEPLSRGTGRPEAFGALAADRDEAFDRVLLEEADRDARRRLGQDDAGQRSGFQPHHDVDPPAAHDLRPAGRSSRKGLVTVGILLGVGVVAAGGAMAVLRGGSNIVPNGEPPTVKAEREPLKVRPENPGGVDIPDQNKQIYERGAQDGQTKVVNREEQPIDVQQAARALPPSPAAAAALAASPPLGLPSSATTAALGEPRRVRTVTVRPDGSFVTPAQASAPTTSIEAKPPAATPVAAATVSRPAPAPSRSESRTPDASATATPAAPVRPTPAPRMPESTPPLAPTPAPADAGPQRTASIAPRAPAGDVPAAGGAAFSVQLAVGATEPEARTLAASLKQRFAGDLGARTPAIRRAELNGKTLYRVRVESLSRDDANALCTKLRTSGGQCFIAKN